MKGIVGAHVSASGGHHNALIAGKELGVEAIQFFGASPRLWSAKRPSREGITMFKKELPLSGVRHMFLHAPYLVNVASSDEAIREKSLRALMDHLHIANDLGVDGLIFHLGSGKELSQEEAMDFSVRGIKRVLKDVPGKARLIIENSAGGGRTMGSTFLHIGELIRKIKDKRIGVCFDTAHAFESGLIELYTPLSVKALWDSFDRDIGMKWLVAIHANDSKTAACSRHDRHENIGEGFIGLKGFKALCKDARLKGIPFILETPGFDGNGPDKENVKRLRSCFGK